VSRLCAPRLLLWAAIVGYAIGFSALSALRHRAFNTGRFDLGNMVQAVWSTAHGDFLEITNLQGEQVSRLSSHFDPILAALAPIWLAWPSPDSLLVVQTVAVALGAVPVFWLARKHLDSERAGLGFALAYLLYPPTQFLTLNEFHPVAFATPLLLLAFWYLDEGRLVPFALVAALAATTKEEIGLVIAGFGLWYALARRQRLAGATILLAGVTVSLVAAEVVVPAFSGSASNFYDRYDQVGGSPTGILRELVTDPGSLFAEAFGGRDLRYLVHLLVPLALLPLLSPLALLAVVPELALNALSRTPTQTSIHFHYVAGEIPALVAAAVLGAAWLARRRPSLEAVAGPGIAAVALAANFHLGAIPVWSRFPGGEDFQADAARVTEHDRIAREALSLVPRDAVVSANNWLGAHLSGRRRILSLPRLGDATWAVADETRPSYLDGTSPVPAARALANLRRNPDWRVVFERDGVVVFRRTSNAP
jgi:uncharacterized membrane protein